jgi:hypothetical protein
MLFVIPVKTGIQDVDLFQKSPWIPAFAGMTVAVEDFEYCFWILVFI